MAALLPGGLPDNYSTLVTALDARPDDELTLEYVKGNLVNEYNRKKKNSSEVAWNSGATSHMCNNKNSFVKLKYEDFDKIITANGQFMEI